MRPSTHDTTDRPCARCGLATGTRIQRDNGIWNHCSPMQCIAELKRALAAVRDTFTTTEAANG